MLFRSKGFINALGLPGKGIDAFILALSKSKVYQFNRPIGISIGGKDEEEFKAIFLKAHAYMSAHPENPYFYELNISCPNVMHGRDLLKEPDAVKQMLNFMRSHTKAVIGVKLSPDQTNEQLLQFTETVKTIPKTFITIGNTTFRKCEAMGLDASAISVGGGGLSGDFLFDRTLEMVKLLSPLKVPLIATGEIGRAHV